MLKFLPEPLTASELQATFDSGLVVGNDFSDALLEKRRESQGHAINLQTYKNISSHVLHVKTFGFSTEVPLIVYLACRL